MLPIKRHRVAEWTEKKTYLNAAYTWLNDLDTNKKLWKWWDGKIHSMEMEKLGSNTHIKQNRLSLKQRL